MFTVLLIIGGIVLFIFCLWAGLLGFFFQVLFGIIGALTGSKSSGGSSSSDKDSFGGGGFGGGGSSGDY
jgi:hypothetical protein